MPFQSKRFPLLAKDYSDEKNTFGIFGLVSAHFPFFCINRIALFVRSPNFLDLCKSLGQSWNPVLLLACHQLDHVYRESIFSPNYLHSPFSLLWCKPEFLEAGFTACGISKAAFSTDTSLFGWLNAIPRCHNAIIYSVDPLLILCVCFLSRLRKGKKSFRLNLLGSCQREASSHRYEK